MKDNILKFLLSSSSENILSHKWEEISSIHSKILTLRCKDCGYYLIGFIFKDGSMTRIFAKDQDSDNIEPINCNACKMNQALL